jgi:hypothetical protein
MIKYLAIPLILVGCTAPVTDPPAHACSPRLDPSEPKPKPLIPRESTRGEIDIWNPHHFIHMEQMFIRNARRTEIEKTMTQPEDAINKALMEFNNGDRN